MSPSATRFQGHVLDDEQAVDVSDCRRWLQHHHEGRLSYLSGVGPRSVVVCYTLADDQVLMKVPDYNNIAHYAPGTEVSLAVDGEVKPTSGGEPTIEEVTVTGTAACLDETDRSVADSVRFEESWPAGIKVSVVALPLTHLVGVQRRTDHRHANLRVVTS